MGNAFDIEPGRSATGITVNTTLGQPCRAIYIGTAANYDFFVNGAWVTFQGTTAGSLLPIRATGARVTSGSGAPTAGDIVFIY